MQLTKNPQNERAPERCRLESGKTCPLQPLAALRISLLLQRQLQAMSLDQPALRALSRPTGA